MDRQPTLVVERLTARPDQIDRLKAWLCIVAEQTRILPGVYQLELLQSAEHRTEFVFFLIVDDVASVDAMLDQADWHQQLLQELPALIADTPERIIGTKLA